ncbi:MFS transporter [Acidovorax sp.]|uniref:MFS transporter n=1 Tax=Acidovorax sp. TaxID=1872122 RepID=UPI002ACD2CD2|nr:MFS transporter [Acidovorax sp.]MDZ7864175.1 MFS transporter [Acidovorax sp.]
MQRLQSATTVARLGTAQTLAWASTYYLPAILAVPMARDMGISVAMVFAAFSCALVVSALLGPYAGRSIDRWGGRPVLMATSGVFALGLAALAMAQGPWSLFAAWVLLGIGMGSGLYEAAFAALVHLHGKNARNSITGITLIAGFASTVGWPLSMWMESQWGWRGACWAWAALHLVLGLPLNAWTPRRAAAEAAPVGTAAGAAAPAADAAPAHARRATVLLAFVFAATWFTSTAMAAHLPRLLQEGGATLATAVAVGALVGPAQVAGRLLEFGLLRHVHPLLSARLAALMHPLGAGLLAVAGAPVAAVFALFHGAGNGILTIAKGTLPLVLFGPAGYGHRQGLLMVPARIAQAAAPWLFGLCLDRLGAGALWVSAGLGVAAFLALLAVASPAGAGPRAREA